MNQLQKHPFDERAMRSGVETLTPMALGERISAFREDKGFSREGLARKLGVSRQTVWYWETGRRMPRQKALAKLAALGFRESRFGHEWTKDAVMILREAKKRLTEDLGIGPEAIHILIED